MLFYYGEFSPDEYKGTFILEDADENKEDNPNDNEDAGNENQDQNQDNPPANEGGGDEGGDPGDFDMPDEEGGNEEDEEGGEEGGDDIGGEDTGDMGDTGGNDPVKDIESEIFANMSSEQLAIKNKELKNRFLTMYNDIQNIMDRLNEIPKTVEIIRPLAFIFRKLDYTADMIVDYVTDTYDTLGYVENEINYNKFYSILIGIDNMFQEVIKKNKMDKPKPKPKDISTDDIPVGV